MSDRARMRALAERTLALAEQTTPTPWRSLGLTVLDAERFVVARMASMRGQRRFCTDAHPNAEWIAFSRQAAPSLARDVLTLLELLDAQA